MEEKYKTLNRSEEFAIMHIYPAMSVTSLKSWHFSFIFTVVVVLIFTDNYQYLLFSCERMVRHDSDSRCHANEDANMLNTYAIDSRHIFLST